LLKVWCKSMRMSCIVSASRWLSPGDILRGAADFGVVLPALWCSLFMLQTLVIVAVLNSFCIGSVQYSTAVLVRLQPLQALGSSGIRSGAGSAAILVQFSLLLGSVRGHPPRGSRSRCSPDNLVVQSPLGAVSSDSGRSIFVLVRCSTQPQS